jgi:ferrous-iron efflux pump FieF
MTAQEKIRSAPARSTVSPHTPQLPKYSSGHLMNMAAFASVGVSCTLLLLKIVAYWLTGSIAMLASLADSATDLFTSSVNLFAVRQALTPADAEHRFGHGKAEPLAGLLQAAFIAGSATFLIFESINHLISPHPLEHEFVGVGVMIFSIFATFGLAFFQRYVVRRTRSLAIHADSMHYWGDLLTNLGVIVGILLSTRLGWLVADPLIGLGVAFVLAASAWHVFHQSYDQLMDHELPEEARARIKVIALGHPEVRGVHDLRTRSAGTLSFIQFHLEMDPGLNLARAHEVSDEVEAQLLAAFPGAEIIIHQDPTGAEAPPLLARS